MLDSEFCPRKTRVSVVRFDVQDALVSRRAWMPESDPPQATIFWKSQSTQ